MYHQVIRQRAACYMFGRAVSARRIWAATTIRQLTAVIVVLVGSIVATGATASAQSGPMPSTAVSPAPQTTPPAPAGAPQSTPPQTTTPANANTQQALPVPAPRRNGAARVEHLPIIDVVPVFTQPLIGGDVPASGNKPSHFTGFYEPVDVGGTIRFPVTRKFSVSFDRVVQGAINAINAREATASGAYSYPTQFRDIILIFRADEQLTPQLLLEVGESSRHRAFGVGVSNNPRPTTISSAEHHFAYVGTTYTTRPIAWLNQGNFAVNVTGEREQVDHHVATATGSIDEAPHQNIYYEATEAFTLVYPVDRKHGLTFIAKDTIGAGNYYENAPFPYGFTGIMLAQLTKKFNNYFSLSINTINVTQAKQGAPFVYPNTAKVTEVSIVGDFHLDLNQIFRR